MGRAVSPERPLSIVVLGNSLSVLSIPGREGARDGLYAEVLRDELIALGVPTKVHAAGQWFDFATSALNRYERDVRPHLPDVLILQYGLNESQPWLLPIGIVRHLMTTHTADRPIGRWYREGVKAAIWQRVRTYRKWASLHTGMWTWQTTPKRFDLAMSQLINAACHDSRPLVLVLDIDAPGALLAHFLHGMPARHAVMQQVLRNVVDRFDNPEVRLFEASKVRDAAGPGATADGMHYSPAGHRAIGEALAVEVSSWLR